MARPIPPLASAIKPETRGRDGGPPILVLGELPVQCEIYAERHGIELVRVLTAHRALEHLARVSFRCVAVSPEAEGGMELVRQVKLATDFGDAEAVEAISRNLLTPFVVLPFRGESEYAVLVVPPEASYVARTFDIGLPAVLFRLDVDKIVRELFRGSS